MAADKAIAKISRLQSRGKVPPIAKYLANADESVRRAAIQALGAIATPEALTAMVPLLANANPKTRIDAAKGIGTIRTSYAKTHIQQRVAIETDAEVRAVMHAVLQGMPQDM